MVNNPTEGLALCLDAQRDLPADDQLSVTSREELLTSLYDIWKFGQDYGGIDTGIVGTIMRDVTKDERKMVERWLQQEIQSGVSNWQKQHLIGFLEKLKEGGD
jgi:hypothetical protein